MNNRDTTVDSLVQSYPGRKELIAELVTLLLTTAPACIHVHAPFSPRLTASLVRSILHATQTAHAFLNGVECLSPRILFDHTLHALTQWDIQWEQGCQSFGAGKYNTDLDAFLEGLRAVAHTKAPVKRLMLVIERAEKFKENLPELMVPLTRLAELSGINFTTIFISEVSWFDLRPPLGAALDPFLVDSPNPSKEDTHSTLVSFFPARPSAPLGPYSSLLQPIYAQFIEALYSVCSQFICDTYEIAYIAAACWPGFISPVLAEWRVTTNFSHDQGDVRTQEESLSGALPSQEACARLRHYFLPSFTRALEVLYPRQQHAHEWVKANAPPLELRISELSGRSEKRGTGHSTEMGSELTNVAKYILVASFLASFNPAKMDARMVGRTLNEKSKRRRGGSRKPRGGGIAKISQRLLGPAAFPLDRLIAILGSLMEEHDSDVPGLYTPGEDEDDVPEKDTEMAVGRIQVSATISELVTMRLLYRTTPADRLDGPLTFKCGISQARAFELARELGIGNLGDFMWDQN